MADLFDRVASVDIGTPGADGARIPSSLRFTFNVKKTVTSEPNKLDLEIYNLSEATRGILGTKIAIDSTAAKEKRKAVILSAGYGNAPEILFKGEVTRIRHERQGPDWVTKIEGADGADAIQNTRVSLSFAAGTTIRIILRAIAKELGVADGEYLALGLDLAFANGFSADGYAKEILERLAQRLGAEWSIQDGKLYMIARDLASADEAVLLTPQTGLVGSPTYTDDGVEFVALLNPKIRPGRLISIKSAAIPVGFYKVEPLDFDGDTRGDKWHVKGQAVEIKAA